MSISLRQRGDEGWLPSPIKLVRAMDPADRGFAELERLTASAVPACLTFYDADHICRFANEHHRAWHGREPSDLVGNHMRDFLGHEAYEARLPYIRRVEAGEQVSFAAAVPYADGSWRKAAIRYVPKMGELGFEGFFTLVFDTSHEQHRFHSIFDGAAVGFWEIDLSNMRAMLAALAAEAGDTLIERVSSDTSIVQKALAVTPVLDLNGKACEMFGLRRDDAIGRPFGTWWPAQSIAAWNRNLLAYLKGDASHEAETVMRREDGTLIDVMISCAFPKDPEKEVQVIVGIVDISRRIAKEKALDSAQAQLAHASRVATLGELMASIAHEVNQPLAAVVANGSAALRWLSRDKPDADEAVSALRRIVAEAERASHIIARTRALAVKTGPDRSAFAPGDMLHETIAITRHQCGSLGAEASLDLAENLPAIHADRVQIQQVVINLVINAAQAMAAGEDDRRHLLVRATVEGQALVIEVADTGPGIPPEKLEHIFTAFYTTKSEGMGMGLSVSKSLVEAHGGALTVRNLEGGGAAFAMRLPLAASA